MKNSTNIFRYSGLCFLILLLIVTACEQQAANSKSDVNLASSPINTQGVLWRDVPQEVNAEAKYLFYLHGLIIENEGTRAVSPKFGEYQYEQILKAFTDKGFVVISEARPKGTIVKEYAMKVVEQINRLLRAGVPPQNITIVGASRGGVIAVAVSTFLRNKNVNFAILAACADWEGYKDFRADLWGNILSIYDDGDDTGAASCEQFFERSSGINRKKEIELKLGHGHGILYRPLKEWVEPVAEWAIDSSGR